MRTPSAAQFRAALSKLPPPTDRLKKLLLAHLQAPKYAMTATLLADKVGYRSYRGFNSAYGHLAKKIGRELKRPPEDIGLIVDSARPGELTNEHWIVYLKANFVRAVRNHAWLRAE